MHIIISFAMVVCVGLLLASSLVWAFTIKPTEELDRNMHNNAIKIFLLALLSLIGLCVYDSIYHSINVI